MSGPDPTAAIIMYVFFGLSIIAGVLLNYFIDKKLNRGWLSFIITLPCAFVWYLLLMWITDLILPLLHIGVGGSTSLGLGMLFLGPMTGILFALGSVCISIGRFLWFKLLKQRTS